MSYIQVVLGLTLVLDLEIEQLGVKTTFLHGDLNEDIHMDQPEVFKVVSKEKLVYQLKKIFSNLNQVPKQWYKKLLYRVIT